jgi:hypothetical protein
MLRDPPEWRVAGLVGDAVLWYLVAFASVLVYRRDIAGRNRNRVGDREHGGAP